MKSGGIAGPVYFHRYVLRSGAALNAASVRREFHGALIKAGEGCGCVHPWPEFGDAPVEEQLRLLATGKSTPLLDLALLCALRDGEARRQGVSLFANLRIPPSHYSWSSGHATAPQIQRVMLEGWPAIKAKGSADWQETSRFLDFLAEATASRRVKLRVDFNGCLSAPQFEEFCRSLTPRARAALDLVEDPVPYEAGAWNALRTRLDVRLALDKSWQSAVDGFDAVVIKPARRDWRVVASKFPKTPLVMTSAMDHPLGQMFAAHQSALAFQSVPERISWCGLATEHLFEPDEFTELIDSTGGILKLRDWGTGLGFDAPLERLPWKRLT